MIDFNGTVSTLTVWNSGFSKTVHFLNFFVPEIFHSRSSFFTVYTVYWLASPAAPAARAAAPGPAPVPAPGRDRPRLSLLASSLRGVAPSPAQLASRVHVAALVCQQLAGQPERRRHRLGRRRRRGLRRLGRQRGGGPHRYHRFQPRPFAGWLGGLAADDVCHHLSGGDSGGV